MADDKQSGVGVGGNNLVILAIAAVSAIYFGWQKPALETFRPTESEHQVHSIGNLQNVDARLWQDPFGAVAQFLDDSKQKTTQTSIHDVPEFVKKSKWSKTLVIGVTLPGGRYPIEVEERRRLRYAVVAALHTAKYTPEDAEHIGYLRIDPNKNGDHLPPGETAVASIGPTDADKIIERGDLSWAHINIPFEWFSYPAEGNSKPPRVAVLWLDESILQVDDRPISQLERLATALHLINGEFVVLGPHDSTTLTSMVREIGSPNAQTHPHQPLTIINFAATADEDDVIRRAGLDSQNEINKLFGDTGIHYYRTIASDRVLADAIVQELERRGVAPWRKVQRRAEDDTKSVKVYPDHIAMISELDSVYGETLPEIVTKAFYDYAATHDTTSHGHLNSIITFSYLRGLDGRLPPGRTTSEGKSSDNDTGLGGLDKQAKSTTSIADNLEASEGMGQFDYLRRLAGQVRERDNQLQQSGEGKIKAIGILGSDVYDKFLLLQALKPEFPDAIFFTTDLDALLLSPSKSKYARNLIVASSYDLRLSDTLQSDISPFRSAYQTSLFLSTRIALRNGMQREAFNTDAEANTKAALKRWINDVRLFEIGRTGALALPAQNSTPLPEDEDARNGSRQDLCGSDILECASVMPQIAPLYPAFKAGSLPSAGLLGAILLFGVFLSSRTLRQLCFAQSSYPNASPRQNSVRSVWLILLGLLALVVSFGLCTAWSAVAGFLTQHGVGEPMALFEGVSVWPTILLRAASFGLCIWLICHTFHLLESNLRETEADMHLRKPHFWFLTRPYFRGRGRSLIRQLIDTISFSWFRPNIGDRHWLSDPDGRTKVPIFYVSVRYAYYGRPSWRLCRAAVGTLAMFALWQLLVPIYGQPNAPIRGRITQEIYGIVTMLDVTATLFLIFLVADATLYLRSFIKQLSAFRSLWPKKTVSHYEQKLGLNGCDLDDWIDIQFLAKRTKCITSLIYFPFLMFALLVVSRSQVFDNFTMTPTLVITQVISVLVIVGSVLALRAAAERARAIAAENLTARIIAAKGASGARANTADQLQILLAGVESLREGAFASLSSQPVVKAILLPLLSYGGSVIAQMYAVPGL